MTKEELLIKLQEERPNQVIHEIISFEKNTLGFYEVLVDMESTFFETKVKHTQVMLPYPLEKFNELDYTEQVTWRLTNNNTI